ncbi:MAG: response regulator, partial [Chloroflexi bacterium]|nr:response regulator [Chloroflexota bacterium]
AAQSGAQALTKALTENPDLIILDVMMPDMDGYEVCRLLRADPATADLPIIMFTAKTQVDEKVAGFQAGADDYLTKPIHPDELTSHVEAVLLRSARRRDDAQSPVRARIIGFLGSKGGVGSTTLAVNVAVALSQGSAKKILLADMRSGLSTISMQLGLRRHGNLAHLLEQPVERIDSRMVEARLDEHSSGVLVLSGQIEPPGVATPVFPSHAEVIIRHLGALADYVLLDLGVGLDETNRSTLMGCYQVVVPVEPQRVSLTLAQTLLDEMTRSLKLAQHRIRVVSVNKSPIAATFTKDTIEEILQHDLAGVITPAPDLAFQAAERGIPMVMIQPDSVVARQIQALATHLADA